MVPQYFCLRQGSKYVGFRQMERSYVVGFRSVYQARHVQYTMHPSADLSLRRQNPPIDISKDMEAGMDQLSMRRPLQSPVILEPGAHLVIPKAPVDMPPELQDGGYHVLTVPGEDFLTMPLTRHVGIVITSDIIEETDTNIVIMCDVLDPQFDAYMFGKT